MVKPNIVIQSFGIFVNIAYTKLILILNNKNRLRKITKSHFFLKKCFQKFWSHFAKFMYFVTCPTHTPRVSKGINLKMLQVKVWPFASAGASWLRKHRLDVHVYVVSNLLPIIQETVPHVQSVYRDT